MLNTRGSASAYLRTSTPAALQPKYGLAVDNILSYQIVTADGTIRTASAKSDPLLFYALRGGGGGVWGVVTQVVYKVYPSSPIVAVVYNLTINPLSSQKQKLAAIADFTTNQAKYEVGWRKQGWSGYTFMLVEIWGIRRSWHAVH